MSSLPASDNELVGQVKQTEPAVSFRYVPSVHAVHAFPSDPTYPMLQMQSVISSLPVSEYVFAGQFRQTEPSV
eukprot:3338061-Rhodomonas_salina.1